MIISDAVQVPWARVTVSPYAVNYSPEPMQHIVRATSDIALIGYGESVLVNGTPYAYYYAEPWLRAVRYTEDGPELGAALRLAPPIQGKHTLLGLVVTDEGEAWIVTGAGSFNGSVTSYLRIGRVTINSTTLVVSVAWLYEIPVANSYFDQAQVALWSSQRTLVLTLGNAANYPALEGAAWLINLDTGAKTAARRCRSASGTTQSVDVRTMAFSSDRQEILVIGDRVTGGYDRPTFWTASVTPTSVGTFTRFVPPGLPVGYRDDIYSEGWASVAVPGGWMAAGIWSRDDDYGYGDDYWGSRRLRNYFFDGSTIIERATPISEKAMGDGYGMSRRVDLDLTDAGEILATLAEPTDRTLNSAGTGIGGVKHVDVRLDGTIRDLQVLPKTSSILEREASVCAVAMGGGRFIYLVSGAGVNGSVTTKLASFGFAVYAGGPIMKAPFVPGLKGTAPAETRRAFRRVN